MVKRVNVIIEKCFLLWGNEYESWGVDIVDVNNNMFSVYYFFFF